MDPKQRRALNIILVIVLLFGLYFIRQYISVIALAAIAAYIFNPVYKWFLKKTKGHANISVTLTLIIAAIVISIPVAIVLTVTVDQAFQVADLIRHAAANGNSIGGIIQNIINGINRTITRLPGHPAYHIRSSQVFNWFKGNTSGIIKSSFTYASGFAGGFAHYLTRAVIFIFIFISFLRNQKRWLFTIKKLNPMDDATADLYLKRMGAMTGAMVKGQFLIALLQGFIDASLLWIVGIHFFLFWFVIITFISIIPLGGGIIVIPAGIILIATGNIWQGIVLIVGHIFLVTNIDNVLRPRFVPKAAQLDASLTILSVFAGIAMFGFLGIVIGPVLMIIIITTIQVYLAANRKVDLEKIEATVH